MESYLQGSKGATRVEKCRSRGACRSRRNPRRNPLLNRTKSRGSQNNAPERSKIDKIIQGGRPTGELKFSSHRNKNCFVRGSGGGGGGQSGETQVIPKLGRQPAQKVNLVNSHQLGANNPPRKSSSYPGKRKGVRVNVHNYVLELFCQKRPEAVALREIVLISNARRRGARESSDPPTELGNPTVNSKWVW